MQTDIKLRSIIIDDEPIARLGLASDLKEVGFVEIIGMAENGIRAVDLISTKKPDLIFLDIEMPGINGLEVVKNLKQPPLVIIVSAYSKYAIEGYALDVIDYLLKPVDFNRLLKACVKARESLAYKNPVQREKPLFTHCFFVKCDGKLEKIESDDLFLVEGANNYVILHTAAKKLLVYETMKNMAGILPRERFLRVHKSFIVAIDKITGIDGYEVIIGTRRINMSRNMKRILVEMLVKK